jgi:hypothetical protein
MAARILLPDGTPASVRSGTWSCADPEAIPVLDYFSRQVVKQIWESEDRAYAPGVVKFLVGARFIDGDHLGLPKDPDAIV